MNPINLRDKFSLFSDHWHPRIVGELNGQQVKLAKIEGEFDWHSHEQEDELFLVLAGSFRMDFEGHSVEVGTGEMLIVPRGIRHRPVAEQECHILLFEPKGTVNTGAERTERTIEPDWI